MDSVNSADPAGGWSPPAVNEQGVAMAGEYPLNLRLRAEALAQARAATDPDGLVDDDTIEATATRLAAEQAEEAQTTPSLRWGRLELLAHAVAMNLTIEEGATKATILDAINAATPAKES